MGVDKWNTWENEFAQYVKENKIDDACIDFSEAEITHTDFKKYHFSIASDFSKVQFCGVADFREAQFSMDAYFNAAKFSGVADFRKVQFSGNTHFSKAQFSGYAEFRETQFRGFAYFNEVQISGYADFFKSQFSEDADFRNALFSGNAIFTSVKFSGWADFLKTQFSMYAYFNKVQICENAYFNEVQFSGDTKFRKARFNGDAYFSEAQYSRFAYFDNAQFSGNAYFSEAQFCENASFNDAQFSGEVDFVNSNIKTLIIEKCYFETVPDFRYGIFESTPHLSNADIPDKGNADESNAQKYRKLKELAIAAHDHQKKLEFFGYEVKAKRGHETKGLRSLPGWLFQIVSNFGQSLVRPICLILAAWIFGVVTTLALTTTSQAIPPGEITCPDFKTDKKSMLSYAIRHATYTSIPIISVSHKEKATINYCLFRGDVPKWRVTVAAIIQQIMSFAGFFFFGLGLRNRFKIE